MQKPGIDTLLYQNTLMHITKYVSELLLKYSVEVSKALLKAERVINILQQ